MGRLTSVDDLPDEVVIRILSLLRLCRDVHCCSLVCKRWVRLAKLVTQFFFYWNKPGDEDGFIQWIGHNNNLRHLSMYMLSKEQISLAWLPAVAKKLHSLSIAAHGNLHDLWTNLSACHHLRCLHIRSNIGNTLPTSPLRNLLFCMIGFYWRVSLSTIEQLLDLCPSLLCLRLEMVEVKSTEPGSYLLKSQSLHLLYLGTRSADCLDNFTVVLDMPKLSCILADVPRLRMLPSTCSVEYIWIQLSMQDVQGLCYSKPSSLFLSSPLNKSDQVIPKLVSMFGSTSPTLRGIKQLNLAIYKLAIHGDDNPLAIIDVPALLELFPGLDTLITHFPSIPALNKWRGWERPLTVQLDYRLPLNVWERQGAEIQFLRELLTTSSGINLSCRGHAFCGDQMPPFQEFTDETRGRASFSRVPGVDQPIPVLVELAAEFPGRVTVHPLQFLPFPGSCLWRAWRDKVQAEAPYTLVDHWCNELHESSLPCGWV